MTVTTRHRWAAALFSTLALAGCSSDHPTNALATESVGAGPVQVQTETRTVTCAADEAHDRAKDEESPADLMVGPLRWPGLRSWATANPADFGDRDSYKLGVVIKADAIVTVSVEDPENGIAALQYGQKAKYSPVREITFKSCEDYDTVFFGGFYSTARQCVPLNIKVPGEADIRVEVSLFAGACA